MAERPVQATKGATRIIPVRVDGSPMPPVLVQTLYIDMHTVGLEVGIAQIVSVAQGNASFTAQHQGFSNLTFDRATAANGQVTVTIRASHLLEPNPGFLLLVGNLENEIVWEVPNSPMFYGGFNSAASMGMPTGPNGIVFRPMGPLTPAFPARMLLRPTGSAPVDLQGVLHEKAENSWIPLLERSQPHGFPG